MPNVRMLPPTGVGNQVRTVNGRSFTGIPGQVFDVADGDAGPLSANGWVWVAYSGPTAGRPTAANGPFAATPGARYFDTDLAALIVFDGATWRSPITGSAV